MGERIPQSTSYLLVFKAYLLTTGLEATGQTIAITISKNGATSFSNPNAGATNATEMASGWYKVTLDTTDTGTLGPLAVRGAAAAIQDVGVALDVVAAIPTAASIATAVWQDTTSGDFTVSGSIGMSLFTSGNAPGAASGLALVGSAMTLSATYDFAKGTTAMTEAYAANAAAPSPVQALFGIHQMLMDFTISGTSYTVKKLDNSTTAFVATLNDPTNPTAIART